ncbi:hypothetical protein BBJ29_003441 [Phytophthora kernoviae]|uniref:Uncharacterized protein n=1 Tax=Phytophthora kernoviae TaxID=325452 RepID=A0A3R7JRS6_9STRA|nr:hypothetical protein BBJ29_003441 [Phytophthora kernoviae]
MRLIFSKLQAHASYNLSYIKELELIAPVVDCMFDLLVSGDRTVARVYYLTRPKSDPTQVLLLSASLSAQDYVVDQQFQKGSAMMLLIAAIDDMRVTTLDHQIAIALNYPYVSEPAFAYAELDGVDGDNYWILKMLSDQQNLDPTKIVRVARRFGRYIRDPTAQSNIETAHWDIPNNPTAELGEWRWFSRAVLHDSWAWTHAIHGVFAIDVIFNLSILSFVICRRLRLGHIWVGDAFSTISSTLLYRGILVIVCNELNGFWTITKMCTSIGDTISDLHVIFYKPELVHADLLAVYLCLTTVLSYLTRERVDPLLAFATFELGWGYRVELADFFPVLRKHIRSFAIADTTNGLLDTSPGLAKLSPMKLLTAYPFQMNRAPLVSSMVISIFSPIVLVLAYIVAQKITRYEDRPSAHGMGRRRSSGYKAGLQQIDLTSFEAATGSALRKRYGVVTGYENYIMRNKQVLATIDAIYGNGFLVANGKFLVATQDLIPLVLMKLSHIRFANIFVYEIIKGSAVKETSRLVYPTTLSWNDLMHLDIIALARVMGVGAALMCLTNYFRATIVTFQVLRSSPIETKSFGTMKSELILGYAGEGLIRDSPLVQNVLGGDTTPRDYTVFLESATNTSFDNCSVVELFDADIYSNTFLRTNFENLASKSSYSITQLADLELVVPVIDCTSPPLVKDDPSLVRVFNLVRHKSDPTNLQLITTSVSLQNYRIPEANRVGPALVTTFFSVNDMRATTVDQHFVIGLDYAFTHEPLYEVYSLEGFSDKGYWNLTSIPEDAFMNPVKTVLTARRRGFYLNAETEQSNTRNLVWTLEQTSPARAMSRWEWKGQPVILDSWAWVHGIHLVFTVQTLFSLGVLALIIYRNVREGKVWIGDAFASLSNSTLMVRGLLVFASWYVNSEWTLLEFCISNANDLTGTQLVPIHSEIVHADLMVMFLSLFGLVGHITKERIDPTVGVFLYEAIHDNRQPIVKMNHFILNTVRKYSDAEYRRGIALVTELQREMSPMRLWTTDKLVGVDNSFVFASFYPKYILTGTLVLFVVVRKIYKQIYPEQLAPSLTGRSADRSTNERAAVAQKGNLTNFEISTGAELQARYGLISDYKNYVFFKGLKFASPDGVYCSGYVIINGKYLVASVDLLTIAMIKTVQTRFINVYAYEVDGYSVQRTARLVYPNTFSWNDLFHLNINILA